MSADDDLLELVVHLLKDTAQADEALRVFNAFAERADGLNREQFGPGVRSIQKFALDSLILSIGRILDKPQAATSLSRLIKIIAKKAPDQFDVLVELLEIGARGVGPQGAGTLERLRQDLELDNSTLSSDIRNILEIRNKDRDSRRVYALTLSDIALTIDQSYMVIDRALSFFYPHSGRLEKAKLLVNDRVRAVVSLIDRAIQ